MFILLSLFVYCNFADQIPGDRKAEGAWRRHEADTRERHIVDRRRRRRRATETENQLQPFRPRSLSPIERPIS